MEAFMSQHCTAFSGTRRIASGAVADVAIEAKDAVDRGETVLIFDDTTSQPIEIDFRGSAADLRGRLTRPAEQPAPDMPRGPGRPKLGVVAREVTLLPRHWEWLNAQPGGASVALRKLVEEARRQNEGNDRRRDARDVALFAGDGARFSAMVATWPKDVREHAEGLARNGFLRL
jgi:hypothetical protein